MWPFTIQLSNYKYTDFLFSLKQTSTVLVDHEEALKKKAQHDLEKLDCQK